MVKDSYRLSAILFALCGSGSLAADAATVAVIPGPLEMKVGEGVFTLNKGTTVVAPATLVSEVDCLSRMLSPATSCRRAGQRQGDGGIVLSLDPQLGDLGAEGYRLRATSQEIVIQAAQPAGIFYGIQTLRQLLPVEIDAQRSARGMTWTVPCVEIRDWPRFPWRGCLLDSCRHFLSVAKVKEVIDLMARYKLNRLHWHLTEDEAWRVEVVYPGVAMPGHATAAILAYPQYRCDGQPVVPGAPGEGGFRSFTANGRRAFCPSRPETYAFLEDVALKVSAMFDTPYVHIGGDEVPQNAWTNCSHCQALIRSEQLKDLVGLQQYFERKMAAFLSAQGKQAIYWGVDLERGIPPGMVVQGWHPGESLTAIRMGFRSINSDCRGTYLDFPAGPGDLGEGVS